MFLVVINQDIDSVRVDSISINLKINNVVVSIIMGPREVLKLSDKARVFIISKSEFHMFYFIIIVLFQAFYFNLKVYLIKFLAQVGRSSMKSRLQIVLVL